MGKKGRIAILTGGGDCPGLNAAIRAVTKSAIKEGYEVIGIRRGWLEYVARLLDASPALCGEQPGGRGDRAAATVRRYGTETSFSA